MAFWVHLSGESIGRKLNKPRKARFISMSKGRKGQEKKWHSKRECGMDLTSGEAVWGELGLSLMRQGRTFWKRLSMLLELLRQKERE